MNFSADDLQAVLWSVTYIFIIVYTIKFKEMGIPLIALVSNFAWETIALLRTTIVDGKTNVTHIVWISLDLLIVLSSYIFVPAPATHTHTHGERNSGAYLLCFT